MISRWIARETSSERVLQPYKDSFNLLHKLNIVPTTPAHFPNSVICHLSHRLSKVFSALLLFGRFYTKLSIRFIWNFLKKLSENFFQTLKLPSKLNLLILIERSTRNPLWNSKFEFNDFSSKRSLIKPFYVFGNLLTHQYAGITYLYRRSLFTKFNWMRRLIQKNCQALCGKQVKHLTVLAIILVFGNTTVKLLKVKLLNHRLSICTDPFLCHFCLSSYCSRTSQIQFGGSQNSTSLCKNSKLHVSHVDSGHRWPIRLANMAIREPTRTASYIVRLA